MSTVSLEKFYQSLRGLTEAFGGRKMTQEDRTLLKNRLDVSLDHMYPRIKKKKQLLKALYEIKESLKRAGIGAEVIEHGSRVGLRIFSDNIFPPGSAIPTREAMVHFQALCKKFKDSGFHMSIIGYTDNTPIKSEKFKNNWELSVYRAITVLRFFIACGYDKRLLSAAGRGEYDPIAPNDTPNNRARNRRIEFMIEIPGVG